jgi:S-adenosylmethionine:tRNA ribosyltransferase-isomerase
MLIRPERFRYRGKKMTEQTVVNEKIKTDLKTSDFYYDLPPELIAQSPAEKRDMSRLLVVNRKSGQTEHKVFHDIIDYVSENDVLVINDSKVIPARIFGISEKNGREVEFLLLRQRGNDIWETLVRPGKKAREGDKFSFGKEIMKGEIVGIVDDGNRLVKFEYDHSHTIYELLDKLGSMPLPPYITKKPDDPSRYQTVYANKEGSAAAPTAGLHFTPELLEAIKAKGCAVCRVMLHVGLGTFRPVKEERIENHHMHTEYFEISEESANEINRRRAAGGRVIAVGTTSCRVLESASDGNGVLHAMSADTGIFIYPGYKFKTVDALITNFHLPESTLLMLVSAFSSRDIMLDAYKTAVDEKYRFFSFGDAMFIV